MVLPGVPGEYPKWLKPLIIIFTTSVWLYLWLFPWQAELHHIYFLQLGVGLAIFIAPGFCVYGILSKHPGIDLNHFTFGFVISHLLFASLGTVGRILHLSFETVMFIMMVLGLILILIYLFSRVKRGFKFQMDWQYIFSVMLILLVSIPVILIVIQRVVTDDDLTYLAYTTNMQYSTSLNFHDPIFNGSYLSGPRFWLMNAPFAQALLAEISKVPGLLIIGGYYAPFLVILSVLCWYGLAIALKLSPRAACASVILQLVFLLLLSEYLHPGAPYFNQLDADKATAAFIFAPVFFQSLIKYLEAPIRYNLLLFLLTGFSLAFMHPIILAYAVFIGGMLILLHGGGHGLYDRLIPLAILAMILAPQVVLRFIKIPSVVSISYDPEVVLNQGGSDNLVSRWADTPFYGFNPDVLTIKTPYEENFQIPAKALNWGWLLVPILAVTFAWRQRDNSVAQFILSGFVLCLLTAFPLTGWVFGYFLSPRMLARSVWLFPFGLSALFLILTIRNHIRTRQPDKPRSRRKISVSSAWGISTLALVTLGLFALYMRENNIIDFEKFVGKTQRYQGLLMAGQVLDQQIVDQANVMGSPIINDLIPAVSWKSRLVTFRTSNTSNMLYFTLGEIQERITDSRVVFSKSASAENKLFILRKYDIRFLLLQRDDIRLFDELIEIYPDNLYVSEVGGFIIVAIK